MKNCFTGKRVRLRALEPQDVEIWVENDRNKDTDMSHCDDCIPLPRPEWMLRQDFPERIKRESEMQSYRFVIENKEGQVVGSINAHSVDVRMGSFSYGLGIQEEFRHKGYASEAILLLMRFYFMELRFHKCNAAAYEFNEASIGLHDRLGFVREGRQREVGYTKGRYWDLIEFGMTKEEFEEKYSEFSQEG